MSVLLPDTILMTADTVGGVWTFSLSLIRALQNQGVKVHLATMGRKLNDVQWEEAACLSNLTIHESSFALEWMNEPWEEVEMAGEWLFALNQTIQPDLVHLNNYAHGDLPWQVPVIVTGHSCVLSWWHEVEREVAPERYGTYARIVRKGLQKADYVVGVTNFMLEALNTYYGSFKSSGVIYNARWEQVFNPLSKEPLIFSMGRLWDKAKNIGALEQIACDLEWPVFIAGEGHSGRALGGGIFLGQLKESEVARWLGRTSIYVLPARYEPFGLSVLEAALCGCALVLGDIPSLREVWGETACYVDPNDPGDLRRKVQSLIANKEKRERLAASAIKQAQKYSFERFGRQYLQIYRQLLQKRELNH